MSITTHERPGVYSSYGASSLIRGSGGRKTVGLVAVNTKATAKTVYTITSYEEAVTTFGSAGGQDMAELIRVILLNGAAAVAAVPIAASTDYEAGFAVLEGQENVSVVVCDSTTETDQQNLRDSVTAASAARRERIAVVGGAAGETVTNLISRAAALNSERVVLAAPGGTDADGDARFEQRAGGAGGPRRDRCGWRRHVGPHRRRGGGWGHCRTERPGPALERGGADGIDRPLPAV